MATQKELKAYVLGFSDAVYVWGANGQKITKAMINRLYNTFKSSTYNRAYYDAKLAEGLGKIGSDCSGMFYKISGYDDTAAGYYNRCTKKGKIDSIPKSKVVLVFKRNSKGKFTHIGCYTGDGYVSEMASSKLNYQRKKLAGNGWDDWGYADFVTDYNTKEKTKLTVDGEWGKSTTRKSQEILGTKVDGIVSNQPVRLKKYVPNALESSWEFEKDGYKAGSSLIKAIQELCGMKGRDVDGHCGEQTVEAMQEFLKARKLYTGAIDGIMGENTVKAWQKYVNSKL